MYKRDIKNFPQEIVEKMLDCQVAQGNDRDVTVFEANCIADKNHGGFSWSYTSEDYNFWNNVISLKNFSVFFEKYPKSTYPKVMMVSDDNIHFKKRVVFMEKCGKYITWSNAETLEHAENQIYVCDWKYAKDIVEPQIVELTLDDISKGKGVGVDPSLLRIKK